MIVVAFFAECNSATLVPTASGVSGASLGSFTKRASISNTGGSGYALEVWYKLATGAVSGEVITITYSQTYDCTAMVAFGVAGATQWDPNGALPSTQKTTRNTIPFGTLSTTNNNVMLLQFTGETQNAALTLPGPGWAFIDGAHNSHALSASVACGYTNAVNPQSSMSVPWGQIVECISSSDPSPYILDALSP